MHGFWHIITVRDSFCQTVFKNNLYIVLKYLYDLKMNKIVEYDTSAKSL